MKKLALLLILVLFATNAPLTWADTTLSNATISTDTMWTKNNSPYFLNGNVTVASGATLTIEAGVEVRVASGRKIDVYGNLQIFGSTSDKIIFTAQEDDGVYTFPGQSGRWAGIIFESGSSGNVRDANFKYAGYEVFGDTTGPTITNLGGEVNISSTTISNSIYALRNKSGKAVVLASVFDKNTQGIYLEGGELKIENSTVSNTQNDALIAFGPVTNLEVSDSTFSYNKNNMSIELSIPHSIKNITWIGGKYNSVFLWGATTKDTTLSSSTPYVISNISVSSGNTLTLTPGAVLKGGSIDVYGKLVAEGSESQKIVYTSLADDAVSGDVEGNGTTDLNASRTGGVLIHQGASMIAKYFQIKYSGESQFLGPFNFGYGALTNNGGSIYGEHLSLFTLNGSAIHHETGSTTIISSEIGGSYDRSIVYKEGNLYITNSAFTPSYANLSLRNKSVSSENVPDLRSNFWGTPEGPYHPTYNATGTASLIEGEALFIPFLTSLDQIIKDPLPATPANDDKSEEGGQSGATSTASQIEEDSNQSGLPPSGRRHPVEPMSTPAETQVTFPSVVYEIMPPNKTPASSPVHTGRVLGTSTEVVATTTSSSTSSIMEKDQNQNIARYQPAAVSVSWQDDYTELHYLLYLLIGIGLLLLLIFFSRDKRKI